MLIPLGFFGGGGTDAWSIIGQQTLSTTTGLVQFTSIPQTFKHLRVDLVARGSDTTAINNIRVYYNGDNGANYRRFAWEDGWGIRSSNGDSAIYAGWAVSSDSGAGRFGGTSFIIADYTNGGKGKSLLANANALGNSQRSVQGTGASSQTGAITSLQIALSSGSFVANSKFTLYGLVG